MTSKTPPMKTTGLYTVASPFQLQQRSYTTVAIRSIRALVANDGNVFLTYYAPFNILRTRYDEDLAADVNLITLADSDGQTVVIPSSFILGYPSEIAIPYSSFILSVDLGEMNDSEYVELLTEEIKAITDRFTGTDSKPMIHRRSTEEVVSVKEDILRKAILKNNRGNVLSTLGHLEIVQAENQRLQAHISNLETLVNNLSS